MGGRGRTPVGEILWYSDFRISICIHLFYFVSFRFVPFRSFSRTQLVHARPSRTHSCSHLRQPARRGSRAGRRKRGNYSLCIQNLFCKQSKCHYKQIGLCAMLFVLCCGALAFLPRERELELTLAPLGNRSSAPQGRPRAKGSSLHYVMPVMTRRGGCLPGCLPRHVCEPV